MSTLSTFGAPGLRPNGQIEPNDNGFIVPVVEALEKLQLERPKVDKVDTVPPFGRLMRQ